MSFKAKLAMWRERKAERTGVKVEAPVAVEVEAVEEVVVEEAPVVEEEEVVAEEAPVVEEAPAEEEEALEDMTKAELYDIADDMDIEGRSGMSKAELLEAIKAAQ